MKRDTFTIRKAFYKPLLSLSDEQSGRLFKAVFQYQMGETPEVADDIAVHFSYYEAEFEEQEAKRRRRAEAAAERRRKKKETANAPEAEETPESPETPTTPATKYVAEILVSDMPKAELDRKCLSFRQRMIRRDEKVFFSGLHLMNVEQYATLMRTMTEEKLIEQIWKLARIKKFENDEDEYFQALMQSYYDDLDHA